MVKKTVKVAADGNGHDKDLSVKELLQQIVKNQQETEERLNDLEDGKTKDPRAMAALKMVNVTFDTDKKHMPEMTRLPLASIKHLVRSVMLDAILAPEVQSGEVSLSEVGREALYRFMRSVHMSHLMAAYRQTQEQTAAETEEAETRELGSID